MLPEYAVDEGRPSLPTSRLSSAFTKTQIRPPQKLTSAAKSSAMIQPNLVAMYAVEIGAIPPARLAHVFINAERDPACSGVKSMQVAHQLGAAKWLNPAATANNRIADVLFTL